MMSQALLCLCRRNSAGHEERTGNESRCGLTFLLSCAPACIQAYCCSFAGCSCHVNSTRADQEGVSLTHGEVESWEEIKEELEQTGESSGKRG